MKTDTKKRRRFMVGTLVTSTSEVINETARKFIVKVRYYKEFPSYDIPGDYIVAGLRKYKRE